MPAVRRLSFLLIALAFGCGPEKKPFAVTSVSVTSSGGTAFASLGETRQLAVVAETNEGTRTDPTTFTWVSSAPDIVKIDTAGIATSVRDGAATITATLGGVSGTIELTVHQATVSLTISPTQVTLEAGTTQQFTAVASDAAGHSASLNNLRWSVASAAVASVDARGLVTAKAMGMTTVTATLGPLVATAQLEVTPAVPGTVNVTGTATINSIEGTTQLSAQVLDTRNQVIPDASISWSSSNEAVATVNSSGLVTGVANGTSEITAQAGAVSGRLVVTVQQLVSSVTVSPAAPTLRPGQTQMFAAAALDAHGHAVAGAPAATWTTSDAAIATIDSAGVATALAVGASTQVTITATVAGVTGSATLTVDPNAIEVAAVLLSGGGGSPDLSALGDTLQLTAEARDALNQVVPNTTFSWTSDNAAAATVDSDGLVTATGNGTATITASAGGKSATVTITVAQQIAAVAVATSQSGASLTLTSIGATLQLVGRAEDANGHAVPGVDFDWASTGGTVSVSEDGLVTALSNGMATVQASSGGIVGGVDVIVQQEVSTIVVTGSGDSLDLSTAGDTLQLSAAASDAGGTAVPGAQFTWTSASPAVATVDGDGLVTAVAAGSAVVRAESGGKQGTVTVTVGGSTVVTPTFAVVAATIGSAVPATTTFSAVFKDGLGTVVQGFNFSWSITDSTLAAIAANGVVTVAQPQSGAFAGASTTVKATGNGREGSGQLFVAAHPEFTFATSGGAGLSVTVNQGQYVVFRNSDGVPHSIVWDSAGAPANIGTFSGSSDSAAVHVTQSAGSYSFHCGIHGTSMKGTLTIQ